MQRALGLISAASGRVDAACHAGTHVSHGSRYVRLAFGQQARAVGIVQSMGSRGDCFDNAVVESFYATVKKGLMHRNSWPEKAEPRTEVFRYIEIFFNRQRRHRAPGLFPIQPTN